jgi:putative membrane protein
MTRASKFLSDQDKASVERAIAEAEKQTSAEIMVVVATRSGRYDRAEDFFGVLLALLAVAGAWTLWQGLHPASGDWSSGHELAIGLLPVLGLVVFWFLVGVGLATRFPILAKPFVARAQFEAEVRRRGFEAFHLFRMGRTKGRNGVLIYVSLVERMAWVVGDDAVTEALPQTTWEGATRAIGEGFSTGKHADGLAQAVKLCADALAPKFPRAADDRDEIPNTVKVLD